MAQTQYVRHVAYKITILDIYNGKYFQEDEQSPNYLLVQESKIHRLNIVAILVGKEQVGSITNLTLDDGTGTIVVRSFEENKHITSSQIGDTLLVIGKVRVYNQEKYISPEIVKKVDQLWLKVRSLEIQPRLETKEEVEKESVGEKISKENETIAKMQTEVVDIEVQEKTLEVETIETTESNGLESVLPIEKLLVLIKEMDVGEGVAIEEVITKSMINDADQLIQKMLENGDIFQITPGKVKVL